MMHPSRNLIFIFVAAFAAATSLHAQAGVTAVLPNGREIHPAGNWIPVAPYPFALAVRKDSFGVATKLNLKELYKSSRLLTEITGAHVAPNKAVVGANAFAHEAGIHQDGIIKNPLTYEIISPEAVGVPARSLVLGKHSGRNALKQTLKELGYEPSDAELKEVYSRLTTFADQSKEVRARDVMAIAHEVIRRKGSPVTTGVTPAA